MPELYDLFPILFVIALAVIAVVAVVIVVQIVANVRRVRQAGHNPLTLQADLTTKLLDSEMLSKDRSTEERLGELDRLHDRQAISEDEYRTARARVLAGR
ncbi:SHOCT domain-containing protein [Herbiconiux moechotypicola]|uniref:SHOCT domain-containing protein n=1 Tax=Herbiconiux moechotypicola TaxID=637393 RepID=A0ABP5QG55_9MICO|nr:SHOCT domain-containing protein [Herbiconiux moechotypicola]MCS5730082.1 SHOCT domain-containing protein [Herbiconiux moechotypicola]